MEATVKRNGTWLLVAIAVAIAASVIGCKKNDDAAIKALEELTAQLSAQVEEQNTAIEKLAADVEGCMKDLAEAKGGAVVMTTIDSEVAVPSLEGEVSVESLEALKSALNEASDAQKAAMKDLEAKKAQCAEDLEAAQAAAAAEAEAAEKAAARKRRQQKKKPTAVRKAEEEGKPTQGVRSRY